ncbi:acyl-CoA dehydrogenase family protein [Halobacillus sp. GSS1]|uniref:acyl-CoA dehydrogenase family protein n=1 Tax=Halobacillus sp. GSS1 TaxID=2815919 RepID=UPI001A8D9FE9|nr:acyl-CoA dehydrogenase family protein [Halobacillus sp. GSS1]MBN9654203.1 acyl-CoA dehydrogenase family protein [Halobacillus sp. GSS1]
MDRPFITESHDIFRKSLRSYLDKEVRPHFEQWEEQRQLPHTFWKQLGELGFLCPWLDEEYGGMNADFGYSVVFAEEMEKVGAGLSGPGLHNDIVMPYISSFGTEDQKKKWLPKSTTGELISSVAMTEPGTGSDLAAIKTTAVRDGGDFILNGEKTFITNGATTNFVIVVCKTDVEAVPAHNGISLLVVDATEGVVPGFKKGKKLNKVGQHASDTSELIFEDCRVPVSHLLGEEGKGFYYLMEKLQQERLTVAISALTSAERMLELTMEYVKQRKAFGKRISDFQNTQFKMAEMATEIKIGRTFVDQLIVNHIEGKNIVNEVSMAKWWTTDLAKKVAMECMQLHGGYGYMEEYEIARRYRDIPITSVYAGTNEIMKVIIAKNLGL